MSETVAKPKTIAPDKLAMSRALGAAFLSHQVEQLERSVSEKDNWRPRPPSNPNANSSGYPSRGRPRADSRSRRFKETRRSREEAPAAWSKKPSTDHSDKGEKDADLIVIDASVLIYGLSHLKKWSRDGREEIVIVPLEALNTLDALKKGSTITARLARAASRLLEQQVGPNTRIIVQNDDAFVAWEDLIQHGRKSHASNDQSQKSNDLAPSKDTSELSPSSAPEWLRRTLCCAAFELQKSKTQESEKRVLLAISSQPENLSPIVNGPNYRHDRATGAAVQTWASYLSIPTLTVPPDSPPTVVAHAKPLHKEKPSMIERPPAVLAMEGAQVNTNGITGNSEGKVIRLLTRGTKLDP